MVVAEVPLWVSHGNNASAAASVAASNAARTIPGAAGMASGLSKPNEPSSSLLLDDRKANNSRTSADDRSAAKAALSLLSSTRGGSQRAPMYSVDVHPDGTRFATAAGDGTVKVWGLGRLFGGGLTNEEESDAARNGERGKKRGRKKGASSRFTESGNYVSSNSEDYYDGTSSSSEERDGRPSPSTREQPRQPPASLQQVGVNDLSGLVRKKKDGGKAKGAAVAVNPFTSNAATNAALNNNSEGPLSSLSRLSSAATNNANNARTSNQGSSLNDVIPSKSKNKQQHKLLSTISSHEGSVLSLRFSPSGIYLATAGDDSYVNIYVRSSSPSLAKGNLVGVGADGSGGNSNGGNNEDVEHWNRIAICRGHHLDVVGLAWAPDDSHLVSCSLDSANPVIVWRLFDVLDSDPNGSGVGGPPAGGAGKMGSVNNPASSMHIHNLHPFKILGRDVHTSTVKGVAFDPAGKYVATSGDDPAICIWRASDDWGLEARIDASNSGIFRSKRRRAKGGKVSPGGNNGEDSNREDEDYDDPGELASLSLFRRISFAPDGSHVCGTNATLRGKNIAAMIGREGWTATGKGSEGGVAGPRHPPGAANLVGHKQPVVASRHCPVFFCVPGKAKRRGSEDGESSSSSSGSEEDSEDGEVEYATLVALGDKRGFVTVWSTKSSRPIFKMQCSESRCTVTDISWGLVRNSKIEEDGGGSSSLVMIVSLLDGYIVALCFDIPTEVGGGRILPIEKTCRIFSTKYGIDDFVGNYGVSPGVCRPRKRLVDDAGPMLIENALQLTMEMEAEKEVEDDSDGDEESGHEDDPGKRGKGIDEEGTKQIGSSLDENATIPTTGNIKDKQEESTKSGKKRIRPVLMNANNDDVIGGGGGVVSNISDEENTGGVEKETGKKKRHKKSKDKQQPLDLLRNALDAASQAALVAEGISAQAANRADDAVGGRVSGSQGPAAQESNATHLQTQTPTESHPITGALLGPVLRISCSTSKMFSVDLVKSTPASSSTTTSALDNDNVDRIVADCTNSIGGGGPSSASNASSSWPCATLTISRGGIRRWKDVIVRAKCTALAANDRLLVVGTADGCLYLYRTSPTLGWTSGKAFRAHPPLVLGSPVVEISISSSTSSTNPMDDYNAPTRYQSLSSCEMVVVTSDGNFYVYSLLPLGPKLNYKGSVAPAMQHMLLSISPVSPPLPNQRGQPKMARIQITDSKQLMLILLLSPTKSPPSAGRLLQGFIYNCDMELWMRISDSNNFLLSDFYSSLPGALNESCAYEEGQGGDGVGILATMDLLVKSGASTMASARQMYQKIVESDTHNNGTATRTSQKIVTRSHCEDRLACAIALGSMPEFLTWMKYYARCLASGMGDADALRFLVDILLGGDQSTSSNGDPDMIGEGEIPSILSMVGNRQCFGLEGKDVIRKVILPEMSKNRSLQRLTNEISMELECL